MCVWSVGQSGSLNVRRHEAARLPHGPHGHGQHYPRSGVVIVVVLTASSRVAVAVTAVVE